MWRINWEKDKRGDMLSCFSNVQLFVILWTVAHQPSMSMGFSRQESWSGLPFPSPGDLPNPGKIPNCISYVFLQWQAGSLPLALPGRQISATPSICVLHIYRRKLWQIQPLVYRASVFLSELYLNSGCSKIIVAYR